MIERAGTYNGVPIFERRRQVREERKRKGTRGRGKRAGARPSNSKIFFAEMEKTNSWRLVEGKKKEETETTGKSRKEEKEEKGVKIRKR